MHSKNNHRRKNPSSNIKRNNELENAKYSSVIFIRTTDTKYHRPRVAPKITIAINFTFISSVLVNPFLIIQIRIEGAISYKNLEN